MSEGVKQLLGAGFIFLAVALLFSVIAWPIAWYHYSVNKLAMENGYEQRMIPGSSSPAWVKADGNKPPEK